MNITELRYLVAIMKWGSVSAAAKQLYAAQPNVSKALKNLEEEYGLRIFERSSTGMIPTEQGKRFIRQAQRVLQQVDELKQEAHQQRSCAELRVVLTHATYASYAAVDFLQQAARSEQLRAHIRESGAIEALDFVLRQGYHMALLRYAAEDEDYYLRYCQRHGLRQEHTTQIDIIPDIQGKKMAAIRCFGAVSMASDYKEEAYHFLMYFLNSVIQESTSTNGMSLSANGVLGTDYPVQVSAIRTKLSFLDQSKQDLAIKAFQSLEGAYFPTEVEHFIYEEIIENSSLLYGPQTDFKKIWQDKLSALADKAWNDYHTQVTE